jgi:hypothetical protein
MSTHKFYFNTLNSQLLLRINHKSFGYFLYATNNKTIFASLGVDTHKKLQFLGTFIINKLLKQ